MSKIDKKRQSIDKNQMEENNVNMEHVVKIGRRVRTVEKEVQDGSLIVEGLFEGYPERIVLGKSGKAKRIGTNPFNGRVYSRQTTWGTK